MIQRISFPLCPTCRCPPTLSTIVFYVSANLKKHLGELSKRGPHRVLVGDLAYAGLEGKVYTPAEGKALPAVAFGHDWKKKVKNYHATLRHLASWGIVVVAPDTESGLIPDHRAFAADLESALQIAAGVKLGQGNISVSPGKLGLVGHGMGGGAAVLTAVGNEKVHSVAALFPAKVSPSADAAAREVRVPGMVIGSTRDDVFTTGNPRRLAENWSGPVVYREMTKAQQSGFAEDKLFQLALGNGFFQDGPRELTRALLTGYLLATLDNQNKYEGFKDPAATAKGFNAVDLLAK